MKLLLETRTFIFHKFINLSFIKQYYSYLQLKLINFQYFILMS